MINEIKSLFKSTIVLLFSKKREEVDARRSQVVVRSSAISFVAKICTMLLAIVTMPIVYNALDKYQFGVYATLTSIISWIDMFDFGITQGLRNRLTEARVSGDVQRGKKLISTSYCLLSFIAGTIFLIYILFISRINWQAILNADEISRDILDEMAFCVISCFLVRFVASVINKIYFACQKAFMVDVTQLIGKVFYLVSVIVLSKTNNITLFNVAVLQSGIAALVPILASIYFFRFVEREYSPSFRCIDFRITSSILGLGWQFFIIQLALLVIHSGNNLLISQFVDPSSVPSYSLSYQLFSYTLLAYTIIITPLWSAYTEAWKMGRIEWIKKTMNRMKIIFVCFTIGCLLMAFLSPMIFRIWIGPKADVPVYMALAVAVMILLDMWIRIFDFFINGVGKVRVQMIVNIVMACINIPLAYVFSVVCGFGAIGVVFASIISYSVSAVISPIQARMILNGSSKGIWDK